MVVKLFIIGHLALQPLLHVLDRFGPGLDLLAEKAHFPPRSFHAVPAPVGNDPTAGQQLKFCLAEPERFSGVHDLAF